MKTAKQQMRVIIDLDEYGEAGWQERVRANLGDGHEVALKHFNDSFHLGDCLKLEREYGVRFAMSSDGAEGHFKKRHFNSNEPAA